MDDLLSHIIGLTSQWDPANDVVNLCEQACKTRNRSDVAILFGALQKPLSDGARQVWGEFCDDFLSWNINCGVRETTKSPSLETRYQPEPTRAHQWIAEMCVSYGARCLSINFDGLTRRAIDNYVGTDGKGVILDTAEKAENFFSRAPLRENRKPLYGVFKVRGDIFYARCCTPGCPLEQVGAPVYDLDSYSKSPGDVEPKTKSVLACPECGELRTLQIGFPGHHEKEVESEKILACLWRFVVPSTSMFVLLGFSGEWDRSIVDFIFEASRYQKIPVLDVRLEPKEGAKHFIRGVWNTEYNDVNYSPEYDKADHFAELMRQTAGRQPPLRLVPTDSKPTHLRGFSSQVPPDEIWHPKGWDSPYGSGAICNEREFAELNYFSQLGLKTFWWGAIDSVNKHNRYLHSIGVMSVAELWHKKLFESDTSCEVEIERELLRIAALLHDFGHLPFSHLFEEIFDELHWIASPQSERPWHEVLTRQKFDTLLTKQLGDELSVESYIRERLGYEPADILNLIDGCSGKAYLDAMVNSPLDADKVDYVFRDLAFLKNFGSPHTALPGSVPASSATDWLNQFLEHQELSPEGLIRLNMRSSLMALDLLETRRDLYLKFYLAPELRAMERITAFVLVCYLGRFLPEKLYEDIVGSESPFVFDHGVKKVTIASSVVIDKYASIIRATQTEQNPILREGLLLEQILEELCQGTDWIDSAVIDVLQRLRDLIGSFPTSKDTNDVSLGKKVKETYGKLHVAGPYYADSRHEPELREIVRELTLLYQGAVLFDVVRTPRLLATPISRHFGAVSGTRMDLYGETFLVPDGHPSQWSIKSRAKVPLHTVDFGHLNHRYLQILLLDPLDQPAKSSYIHQQFRRRCARANMDFMESPVVVFGGSNGSH